MVYSFSTSDERIHLVDNLVKKGYYPDRSTFINTGIDLLLKTHHTNRLMDFLNFIFTPVILFLGCIGATLFLKSLFFFVLSGITGLYLMVFIYLFYNKYKGVKRYGNNNK